MEGSYLAYMERLNDEKGKGVEMLIWILNYYGLILWITLGSLICEY